MGMLRDRGIPEPPGDPEPAWSDPDNPTDDELVKYVQWRKRNREYLERHYRAEPDHDEDDLNPAIS